MKRELHPEMRDWLDSQCRDTAHRALIAADARACFIHAAKACIGIREHGGNNRGKIVELIQQTIGVAEREPWCMSLVQTCLAWAELRTGKISPIFASEHCLTVWQNTPAPHRVKAIPAPGAIIIWRHGAGPAGHTGITIAKVNSHGLFRAVEGNTESGLTAAGKIEREGGGCYETERSIHGSGNMKLLGFLKPF
jgi:hypothetical protein